VSGKNVEIKVGDVWQTNGGRVKLRVKSVVPDTFGRMVVRWEGINRRDQGTCSLANFPKKRTLIERDGKAVSK
jgi:hypothetical protein